MFFIMDDLRAPASLPPSFPATLIPVYHGTDIAACDGDLRATIRTLIPENAVPEKQVIGAAQAVPFELFLPRMNGSTAPNTPIARKARPASLY
ncbi:hypothetical protein [Nitrobacter sp. TKz-YC01]|uniref:hypothetical protein n=1 Tax=Nitrobacter sp. TKz-YC01 TaxID=3398703 RepID=UPI003A0FC5E4